MKVRLLRKGEFVEFEGVKLSVDAGDARRIHRIKIELPKAQTGSSEATES